MSVKTYHKPNWINSADVVATKNGWVNTKNNNEVLIAIPNLDGRLAVEDDEVTIPNPPKLTILNSTNVVLDGLVDAAYTFKVGSTTLDGTITGGHITLSFNDLDLANGDIIEVTQKDPDDNISPVGKYTVTKLKGAISFTSNSSDAGKVSVAGKLTNVAIGAAVKLYDGATLVSTVAVTANNAERLFTITDAAYTFTGTSATFTVKTTDVGGKTISADIKINAPA